MRGLRASTRSRMPDALHFSPPSPTDLEQLAAAGLEADTAGELSAGQVTLMHRQGWLKMLAPRAVGGAELPLPDVVRLEEAVSEADGSCGWVVTLCAGAGWFAGFLPERLAREILSTPGACLAGSGAPTGFADRDGDGWMVSGRWAHATGSQLATHFTFNAQLRERGLPLLDAQGQPRVQAFVVPAAQVRVETDSWHSIGMRATTSRAFAINGARAAGEQAFLIDAAHATAPGPLYRFPFAPLAYATLAACISGLAWRFVGLAEALVSRPVPHLGGANPASQAAWRTGEQALARSRAVFYAELDAAWARVARNERLDDASERRLNDTARALARTAREVVDTLYPHCGLRAADPREAINRAWRDLHTASQHALWLR